jgi:hypothetical protein
MKLFNFKNPRHLKILKEELERAKMLLEYNEAEEWKKMPDKLRKVALMSADSEMGKDFAEEYVDANWLDIPDTITNRIKLSDFALPKKISKNALASWIETNRSKLGDGVLYRGTATHKTSDVIRFLQDGNPSQYYMAEVVACILKRGIPMNFRELEDTSTGMSNTPFIPTQSDPYKSISGMPGKGGWTGD